MASASPHSWKPFSAESIRHSVLLVISVVFLACSASAHQQSDSYLSIHLDEKTVTGRWDVALHDLDKVLHLDANEDGQITWEEIHQQRERISSYILGKLTVKVGGVSGQLRQEQLLFDQHLDGVYAVLRFSVDGVKPADDLEVGYQLFFDYDPFHRGLFRVDRAGQIQSSVFSPMDAVQSFKISKATFSDQLIAFAKQGMTHIWGGYDHILFLIALLLPSVLRRENGAWRAEDQFRPVFITVIKVVTAFTVAHSITLTLAVLQLVNPPRPAIEMVVKASVALAAANNLRPIFFGRAWLLAFGFGLVHGFSLATGLSDMGWRDESLALAIFGFNLGVECGQIMIVALFLPLAFLGRATTFYQRVVFRTGSVCVILLAATWMLEGILGFKVLTF